MKKHLICYFLFFIFGLSASPVGAQTPMPADYEWTTPSSNASESMPCGGGDVGLNVWVEQGDILFYVARSGCFDENNTLLKLGRVRLSLSPGLDMQSFRQVLHTAEGYVEVTDGNISVQLWVDVEKPVVHADISSRKAALNVAATYESWRTHDVTLTRRAAFQTSYKFAAPKGLKTLADRVTADEGAVTFVHQNAATTVFDATVTQQRMDSVKHRLYNPLRNLIFGGRMAGDGFVLMDKVEGQYASTPFEGWMYVTRRPTRRCHVQLTLAGCQGTEKEWNALLAITEKLVSHDADRRKTRRWWRQFWQRSFIEAPDAPSAYRDLVRNYTLFRYMLGCNGRSDWPTKFNGGLFTFDPEYVNQSPEYRLSPDFRNWGGGVHTAQNQRLVYWPMLRSGDYDALRAQLDFYLRIYKNAEERSRLYWGHEGACLTEQIENYGLPCFPEYGTKRPEGFDPGMERNAWLEYEWDTCLEFCQMALDAHSYGGMALEPYLPMILSCLRFFDEHYQYLANQRGAKRLDGQGKLVLYPGSGGETFKGAYNATSTVSALRTVTQSLIRYFEGQHDHRLDGQIGALRQLMERLPDLTVRDGMLQPALHYERVQNVETTQLYPVFPWRQYGVGLPGLDVARNTYLNDSLAVKFRSHVGWKQDLIWAACLGMTDEAARLLRLKMHDGPHRFPAFWGPGYDWTPDHNWGGSGMIGMQEMLLQEAGNRLLLFPAWPKEWNVRFRLHASRNTVVEAELRDGQFINVRVTPAIRQHHIVLPDWAGE